MIGVKNNGESLSQLISISQTQAILYTYYPAHYDVTAERICAYAIGY